MKKEQLETVTGIVKTITFHNDETGYTIAKILPEKGRKKITVTGNIKQLTEGETVVFRGYWYDDPKYGEQFRFISYESVIPASLEGIKRFLASSFMDGIGPVLAGRIVDTFGENTLIILEEHPERLREVKGLNPKKIESIIQGWNAHRHIRDIMIFLRANDISETYASKIYEQYGEKTVDTMRKNPYRLIRDIRGIGFVKADQLASKLGIVKDSPERIRAGILHCMNEFVEKGHVYVPITQLVDTSALLLGSDASSILESVEFLKKAGEIVLENQRVYPSDLYSYECELSQRLKLIAGTNRYGHTPSVPEVESMIKDIETARGITFAPTQREAIVKSALSNILILTGGPGTGKTTTVLGIIEMMKRLKLSVLLCAPTGRAAKRLTEATGSEAKTIHRLLAFNPMRGKFTKNEGDPLQTHVVIMDEASMVDIVLMCEFLRAVSPYMTLIIVGDADQLPSIGPGNVLRDIISSGVLPTIQLTEIFRQAATSDIVRNAHKINSGKLPDLNNRRDGNFFVMKERTPERISASIVDIVAQRLPRHYGVHPIDDIQVISPMYKGETGVENLNLLLQSTLNPPESTLKEMKHGGWVFREGDKVMQIRNNYDKMVFNGDIGRIEKINPSHQLMNVRFDDVVEYIPSELDDLVLAYAISVHKSQGSEFPCVVMPVTTQHFIMLKRNLLYTAVTRASNVVILIGDVRALAIAVKTDPVRERNTSLDERLRS